MKKAEGQQTMSEFRAVSPPVSVHLHSSRDQTSSCEENHVHHAHALSSASPSSPACGACCTASSAANGFPAPDHVSGLALARKSPFADDPEPAGRGGVAFGC